MAQDAELFVEYFNRRFGVRVNYWEKLEIDVGEKTVYIKPDFFPFPENWQFKSAGFRAARLTSKYFKPANRLLQLLDNEINKNLIPLEASQFRQLVVEREEIPLPRLQLERGYVALKFKNYVAGCGFWTGSRLQTQVSKSLGNQFPKKIL
ncbi:MAG: hypothetical protein ACQEP7_00805 [bacterium]